LFTARDVFSARATIQTGGAAKVLNSLKPSPSMPLALQAVRLLAQLRQAPSSDVEKTVLARLGEWLQDSDVKQDQLFVSVAATLYITCNCLKDALSLLHGSRNLEHLALTVQCLLNLNRPDLASKKLNIMKDLDEDDPLTALCGAWVASCSSGDGAEGMQFLRDLIEKFGQTVTILNTMAVLEMRQGNFAEAFGRTREARELAKSNGEALSENTLVNSVVALNHLGRAGELTARIAEKLPPGHPWLQQGAEMEAEFDRAASDFA
jgi:coatomer protein complex subunit epsilon